ncbi:hypothetical protein RhiirA5_410680 [Rhizophagus irregularis]|uniref:Ion transport domain-containing protein n=1 Tax=Rhizophagus irregularis TaxID=588596 RepID=A0A2I1FFB9_9GLOM|nr:hypothetical protein RhiirA5_410680 [Rhizophagus irregularis]PKC70454.1 hypothetical protein RhiirA1_454727 [Rhizophagus irregularis]PKY33066.1 hypothetical protein RhiirB3_451698 [Rhizophagus irregularis]CAB5390349.1 unnamed protein product [Rhizophagus irregularis]
MNELLRASDELYGPLPSGILYIGVRLAIFCVRKHKMTWRRRFPVVHVLVQSPSDGYSSFVRTTFKRPLQRWFSTGPTPLLPGLCLLRNATNIKTKDSTFDSWAVDLYTFIASIFLVIVLQNMLVAYKLFFGNLVFNNFDCLSFSGVYEEVTANRLIVQ